MTCTHVMVTESKQIFFEYSHEKIGGISGALQILGALLLLPISIERLGCN